MPHCLFFSPGTGTEKKGVKREEGVGWGAFARFFWHAADINNGHGLTTAVNPLASVLPCPAAESARVIIKYTKCRREHRCAVPLGSRRRPRRGRQNKRHDVTVYLSLSAKGVHRAVSLSSRYNNLERRRSSTVREPCTVASPARNAGP